MIATRQKPAQVCLESDIAIRRLGVAVITSVGEENVYVEKGGQAFYFKPGNVEQFAAGEHDFSDAVVFDDDPADEIRRLLLAHHGMFGLAGDGNRALRTQLMTLLLGRRAKSTEVGVTALERELHLFAGIDADSMTGARARDALHDWVHAPEEAIAPGMAP